MQGWIADPPTFHDFISSGDYINKVIFSDLQIKSLLAVIGENPKKLFSPDRKHSLGIFCVGKGGGKDYAIAVLDAYIITVLLHHGNPHDLLNLEENLDIVNVATTKTQATEIFFKKFLMRVKQNKFFLENYKIYAEGKVFNPCSKQKSRGDIILNQSMAEFPHDISCFAETSDNESWEGKSVIFFVLDEISGFVSTKGYFTGRKIYQTAQSSCISRTSSRFQGLGFAMSYPRQQHNDIILELYNESKKLENSHMYGIFAFSWQFKPIVEPSEHYHTFDPVTKLWKHKTFLFTSKRFNKVFKYDEGDDVGIPIPIIYQKAFTENPENAMTQYCCIPPPGAGDYIEYPERILSSINYKLRPLFETTDYVEEKTINGKVFKLLKKKIKKCNEENIDNRRGERYVAWVDLGEVFCEACISIGRKVNVKVKTANGGERVVEKVRIVDVINWTPDPSQGITVDLTNVEDFLVTEIKKYVRLEVVGADKWNSSTLMNRLTKVGILPVTYNLALKHYDVGKELFYKSQVEIFDEEEFVNREKKELTSLEQLLALTTTATNVKKQEGLFKDKIDSVIGVINLILGNLFTSKNRPPTQQADMPLPIMLNGMSGQGQPSMKVEESGIEESTIPAPIGLR